MAAGTGSLDLGDTGKDGLATALGRKHAGVLEHLLVDGGLATTWSPGPRTR